MALRITFVQVAMPANVESKTLTTPATLTEWQENAKTALSEKGGFIACTVTEGTEKLLVNVDQVLSVKEL